MKPLWEATRDLHHACEEHPVGSAMASGKPPMEWYADWLAALEGIHSIIDPDLPGVLWRSERLTADIINTGAEPLKLDVVKDYAHQLVADPEARAGAAYVLTGAHLMGGEIMRRRLDGYPTSHLEWDDRQAALAELKKMRECGELAEPARACFQALLDIMDEILEKRGPVK
jgi:hypothetical protein